MATINPAALSRLCHLSDEPYVRPHRATHFEPRSWDPAREWKPVCDEHDPWLWDPSDALLQAGLAIREAQNRWLLGATPLDETPAAWPCPHCGGTGIVRLRRGLTPNTA